MNYTTFTDELALIQDPGIRDLAACMLRAAPAKCLDIPASSTAKYHTEDECQDGGNVLHTKRVVAMVLEFSRAYSLQARDTDYTIAAALIHDILKQGAEVIKCSRLEYDCHGPNLYLWADEMFGYPSLDMAEILDIASRHMGPWSSPAFRPNDPCSWCLFMADYTASRKYIAPVVPVL